MSTKITIVGLPFTVLLRDEIRNSDNDKLDGLYDCSSATIYLAKQSSTDAMEETLLHEVLHGVADACHEDLSEAQVYRLSRALYASGVRPPIKFTDKDLRQTKK